MRQKIKQAVCYLIIIILLPYVITVFINGPDAAVSADIDNTYILVESDGKNIEIPLEEYCIGRLAKEIPAESKEEAIKAQAVLVRTAVYKKIKENGSKGILEDEFWTTEEMEKQWGITLYGKYYKKFQNAWKQTEGQVLIYEENLANAPFCKLTNGNTRDGKEVLGEEYPYLKIKECPLDIEAKEQLQTVILNDMDAEITDSDTAGYVLNVRVGKENVSGEEFRNTYSLASSSFALQKYDGKLRVTTRGVGHGLGLSQYTANEMAKEGDDYRTILNYFFTGTELREVVDIVMNN